MRQLGDSIPLQCATCGHKYRKIAYLWKHSAKCEAAVAAGVCLAVLFFVGGQVGQVPGWIAAAARKEEWYTYSS